MGLRRSYFHEEREGDTFLAVFFILGGIWKSCPEKKTMSDLRPAGWVEISQRRSRGESRACPMISLRQALEFSHRMMTAYFDGASFRWQMDKGRGLLLQAMRCFSSIWKPVPYLFCKMNHLEPVSCVMLKQLAIFCELESWNIFLVIFHWCIFTSIVQLSFCSCAQKPPEMYLRIV